MGRQRIVKLDEVISGKREGSPDESPKGYGHLSRLSEISEVGIKRPRETMDTLYEAEGSTAIRPLPVVSVCLLTVI